MWAGRCAPFLCKRERNRLSVPGELVLPKMERHGPIEAWIIDDTGFPKKGQHSVGVARQYCGELGKQDNCQVAVTLSIANYDASLPVAYQLHLSKDWASDCKGRRMVGIPDEVSFKTKPEIALGQIRWACEAGLSRGVVLMDAGYGVDTTLICARTSRHWAARLAGRARRNIRYFERGAPDGSPKKRKKRDFGGITNRVLSGCSAAS
jgi:SRSO17 transposase